MSFGVASVESRILAAASHDTAPAATGPLPDLENDLEEHRLKVEIDLLQQQFREASDTHDLRLSYANRLFWLVCAWLACVVFAVELTGFKTWGFTLSDPILIAFITTTTINVVGLFFVVAKWLFPSKGNAS